MPMTIAELHKIFLECNSQFSTDSRKISEGDIFFALKGERFDGNLFAKEVIERGAAWAVIDDKKQENAHTILVDDVLIALQELANYHRQTFDIPVIGITGSNGKTTTKELLHGVLSKKYIVHTTRGNLNNHIGVPLTLLSAPTDTEMMIVEMGANHIGEIHDLCEIAAPNFGLITNIGKAHLEGFGSIEGVLKGKTELYRYLASHDSHIFYNDKDTKLRDSIPAQTTKVPYIDWMRLEMDSKFIVISNNKEERSSYTTHLVGSYNGSNMRCAATVGEHFDVAKADILQAIAEYVPSNNRSQLIEKGAYRFLMDAYNANPSSMKLSISSFAGMSTDRKKVLVLGDMAELGENSIDLHAEMIEHLSSYDWAEVILLGPLFAAADKSSHHLHYPDVGAMLTRQEEIREILEERVALIKASRSMKLEQLETLIK